MMSAILTGHAKDQQRGAALLAMLAVVVLGTSWWLVTRLHAESGGRSAVSRSRNAEALNRAKLALIGHIAARATKAGEANPGRLPCPEAAGNIDGTDDGIAAGNCTLPAIGRFPWRTLGTDQLVDAAAEPLWYVVSPGWALSNSTFPPLTTYINSNSNGQLLINARSVTTLSRSAGTATAVSTAHGFKTGDIVKISGATPTGYNVPASVTVVNANTFTYSVDSTLSTPASGTIKAGGAVVALIVAPGQAMNVAASANCTARNQARRVPAPAINALDYLECYDAANGVFSMTGPSSSFNDQVVIITAADIMPGIEVAISRRIKDEIVPALKTVYTHATWGFTTPGITPNNPVLPFPAPFASPGPGTGTSNYHGAIGTPGGLLPFNQMRNCTVSAADPRCTSTVLTYSKASLDVITAGSGSIRTQSNCGWLAAVFVCTGEYLKPSPATLPHISVKVSVKVANVAGGLRTLDLSKVTCTAVDDAGAGDPVKSVTCAVTAALQSDGSVIISAATSALPNIENALWGNWASYKVNIHETAFGDHALLSSTDATTGWFVRNEWYRLLYYATPQSNTAARLPAERSCTAAFDCLSVANMSATTDTIAPILLLAGRSINGSKRPSATLADYLESSNATGAFTRMTISVGNAVPVAQRFNDRVVVVGSN